MDINIEHDLEALREKLATAIADDSRQAAILQARIDKNRALLSHVRSSLNAYRPAGEGRAEADGTKGEKILQAIASLTKTPFSGDDVLTEIKRLFPDARIDRTAVSSLLWKMLDRGAKDFRQIVKGKGRKPSLYEKVNDGVRIRTRGSHAAATNGNESH